MKGTVINRERSSSTRLSLLFLSFLSSLFLLFLYLFLFLFLFVVVVSDGLDGSIAFQSLV